MEWVAGYELLEELGRGGMGVVFRARAPDGEEVAVKLLLPGAALDTELVQRFGREADAGFSLHHPGIVRVLQAGEDEGRLFLVMELLEGPSLREVLKAGPLDPVRAGRLAHNMALALAHAHARGVLHRDLKPANVILTPRGPVLMDLGLTKLVAQRGASLTASGVVMGTPGYMAPEQALGERHEVGPATDLYGLGATLYALLTGQAPFSGATQVQTLRALVEEPVLAPSRLRPGIPAALEQVCLRCLEKEPTARYRSADALALALEQALSGTKLSAASGSRPPALLAGLVVLAVFVGVWAAWWGRPARDSPPSPSVAAVGSDPVTDGPGDDLERLLGVARALNRAEKTVEAREAFAAILERDPNNYEALTEYGDLSFAVGDKVAALASLRHALALDSDDPGVRRNLGVVLHHSGELEEAEQVLRASLERDPDDPTARAYLAMVLVDVGRLGEAWALIEPASEAHRDSAEVWALRASVQRSRGLTEESLRDALYALELNPHHTLAIELVPQLYAELGRRDDEILALERLVQRIPNHSAGMARLGALLLRRGDHAQAIEVLSQALVLDPSRAILLVRRAEALASLGRVQAALSDLDRAIELAPNQLGIYTERARVLSHLKEYERAVADLNHYLAATPDDPEILFARGQLLAGLRRLELAREDLLRARQLRPDHAPTLDNLVRIHSELKDRPRAIEALQAYLELRPDDSEGWFVLCRYRLQLDDRAGSQLALDRHLLLTPRSAPGLGAACYLAILRGELSAARALMRRLPADGPSATELGSMEAFLLLHEGEPQRALDRLGEIPDLPAHLPLPVFIRAEAYRALGRFDEARGAYTRFVEIEPPHHLHQEARETLRALPE